ncbi:MAG: cation diffusion facilitator family transporter [Bacteroidales bacterium]
MENEKHHHHHEVSGKNLGIAILLNVLITIAEAVGGFVSGSMALLSDATHNFSDVISLVVSYVANRLTKRQASENKTFGFKRSEIFAAFLNSATLIILAVFIIVEAVQRLFAPTPISADWVIYLSLLSILVNGVSVLFIKEDAKENINMKSAYLHLFSDMLTSIAVLAGGLAMKYLHLFWVDAVLSIAIAIYLLYLSWDILRTSLKILMQFTPVGINVKQIVSELGKIDGVKNFHHVHVWQLSEHEIMFEAHLDVKDDIKISEFEVVLENVKEVLAKHGINHITIQPEYSVSDSKQLIH